MQEIAERPDSDPISQALHSTLEKAPFAAAEQVLVLLSGTSSFTEKQTRRFLRVFARATLQIVAVENAASDPSSLAGDHQIRPV